MRLEVGETLRLGLIDFAKEVLELREKYNLKGYKLKNNLNGYDEVVR